MEQARGLLAGIMKMILLLVLHLLIKENNKYRYALLVYPTAKDDFLPVKIHAGDSMIWRFIICSRHRHSSKFVNHMEGRYW